MKSMRSVRKILLASAQEVEAAEKLLAVDEGDEILDAAFAGKLRELRGRMPKLVSKKNKTLRQLGVTTMIKPTAKVESVIDVLLKISG